MKPSSVGRFPRGLFSTLLLLVASGWTQTILPSAVITKHPTPQPCTSRSDASIPAYTVEIDCNHQLEYVGSYTADGKYQTVSKYSRWYNQANETTRDYPTASWTGMRPVEVPKFVNLHSGESVVENYQPPAHAQKAVSAPSRLAAFRDDIITFAYGHEKFLIAPQHLTTDSRGRLIIADSVAGAVHVLDGKASFRIATGPRRRLQSPNGVAVDAGDNIYVSDSGRGLIDVYDPSGRFLHYIGKIDDETLFIYPTAIAIDRPNRHLFVLDSPNNLVIMLDLNGNILKKIGKRSTDIVPVQFEYPSEITVGKNGIYILDSAASRILVLDLEGTLVRQFNTHFYTGQTVRGMGLAADPDGNIYLSNVKESEIRVFDPEGNVLSSFGRSGMRDGQFKSPTALWIDSTNHVYVADTENRRVQVFQLSSQTNEKTVLVAGAN